MHYMDANKTAGEETRWQLHKNDACNPEQVLAATPHKSVRPPAHYHGWPRGVMVKAMNCGIVVREFVLQSRYYVHFRANTLGKGMNPLILSPAMGK